MIRSPRRIGQIARTLAITFLSRAVGMLREIIISIGFGLSRATDLFYQLSAAPTYLMTYVTGPFSTAYIAWANGDGAPAEPHYLPFILRTLFRAAIGFALLFWAGAMVFILHRGGSAVDLVAASLMAIACLATAIVGFGSAISNARGQFSRAQGLLFANNATFVALIALAVFTAHRSVELVLTGAFCIAAMLAATLSLRALAPPGGIAALLRRGDPLAPEVSASLRKRFLPMLLWASLETGGFLLTQAIVLLIASLSGTGVTSAASLAQRLCLTANGLIVNPLSNIAMVHMARRAPDARRAFLLRAVGGTILGLGIVAAILILGRGLLLPILGGRGNFSTENAALLASLIPGYALWLVAQGASLMLSRLAFAQDRARLFTLVTTAGYILANIGRLVMWKSQGFAAAIVIGAAVELATALCLLGLLLAGGRGVTPVSKKAIP